MNPCILITLFVVLLAGVTHATLTPQDYWKAALPGTPMPAAIRGLLRQGDGVRHKGFTIQAGCKFSYCWEYSDSAAMQTAGKPHEDLFFLQKHLHPGAKMRLDFTTSSKTAAFIPRGEASTIPFSSDKLPDVLAHFSIQPSSIEAKAMKLTLQECEGKDASEENKYCATSMESMLDFATSALGTRFVRAASSEVVVEQGLAKPKDYNVASFNMLRMPGSSTVTCHPTPWPHALFYCHLARATRAYVVRLVGDDEEEVDAAVVCHDDTSAWNPNHESFQLLKVKPGEVPICHFLPMDHIIWTPRPSVRP